MILATVGTQLPFDRFIRAIDDLAPGLSEPVFAQTGKGRYQPLNMEWRALIPPMEFDEIIGRTSLIVSHAGIGTVVMAQRYGKPVILFPRRAALGEHRNDHQVATVDALDGRPGMYIARTVPELGALLRRPLAPPPPVVASPDRDRLQAAITKFIRDA